MPTGSDLDYAGERLRLLGSRIEDPRNPSNHASGHVHGHDDHAAHTVSVAAAADLDIPAFKKSHAASNFELFYDLWFVANLNVFAGIHGITGGAALRSFMGYILMLWTTWLVTSIYDVRYTSESILERCCRGAHLGVMTGFAVIATKFSPDDQNQAVYKAMSLFLAVSRLVLALQYGMSAWQVRKFKHGRGPLLATAGFHLVAAVAYLVIAYRYVVRDSSRGYIAWYVIGVLEMVLHLVCSQFSPVLTFIGSHFGERLNLLTLIVMGEGVIILAKNITLVVKDTYLKDNTVKVWSELYPFPLTHIPEMNMEADVVPQKGPALIGIVTAATALIYIIFQLYFDWMHGEDESILVGNAAPPLHIAMVLLVEGSNQFISWWRIYESMDKASDTLLNLGNVTLTSEAVTKELNKRVMKWLEKYPPPDIINSYNGVNATLKDIKGLPDSFWKNETIPDNDPLVVRYSDDLSRLFLTMVSGIFNNFKIETPEKTKDGDKATAAAQESHDVLPQSDMIDAIAKRFELVFIYTFLCAGSVLFFLTLMHFISKQRGWTPFNIARTGVCVALALGPALITTVATNEDAVDTFMGSPWMLPTVTLSYFTALVITHLPHPKFGLGKFGRGTYKEVDKRQKHDSESVPLKQVVTSIVVTRPSHEYDPYESRTGVFMSAEGGMPPSPGHNAHIDAHDPMQSPPYSGSVSVMARQE
ncbi:hypothetical protein PG993_001216 [Apiospora rasikravindrae]|uniref:Low temperature requirement A n=1 Tax=Apiospora rasikravindrae TaxID=990691 RepID=A0ABR1UAS7_9PEZI